MTLDLSFALSCPSTYIEALKRQNLNRIFFECLQHLILNCFRDLRQQEMGWFHNFCKSL